MTIPVSGRGDRTTKVVAAATLAATLLLSGMLHDVADERLASILDARWRGAYDILVTSAAASAAPRASHLGPMAPYAIATGPDRLSLTDLEQIRSVAGVELAAPIGDVLVRSEFDGPHLMFQVPFDAADEHPSPTAVRVSTALTVNDGSSTRTLRRASYDVVLDAHGGSSLVMLRGGEVVSNSDCEPGSAGETCFAAQRVPVSYSRVGDPELHQSSGILADDKLLFELPVLTETFPHILFVDPVAEAQLLGEAGRFLEPLFEVGTNFQISDLRHAYRDAPVDQGGQGVVEWLESVAPAEAAWELPGSEQSSHVIPLIVGAGSNIDAELEVAVESGFDGSLHPVLAATSDLLRWELPHGMSAGEPGRARAVDRFTVGSLLEAADPQTMVLPLPGLDTGERLSSPPPRNSRIRAWAFTSQLLPRDVDDVPTLMIDGFLRPVPEEVAGIRSGDWLAVEGTVHQESEAVAHEVIHAQLIPEEQQPLVVAVGTFDWDEPHDTIMDAVPLASIDRSETRLVIDAEGRSTSRQIAPGLAGLGVSSSRPTALASIHTADSLGVDAPISSVRVRVELAHGGYSLANLRRVQEVADSLRAKGYRAQMVAGSSKTPVRFEVDDYPMVDATGAVSRGLLGTVEQSWPELGAVSRVDHAVSNGNQMIASVAVINATTLFGIVFAIHQPERRRSARLLESVGWGRRRIRRSFFREDVRAISVVLLGALATLGMSLHLSEGEGAPSGTMAVAAALLAAVVVCASATQAGSVRSRRRPVRREDPRRDRAHHPLGYGVLLAARRGRTGVLLAATSGTVASACGSLTVVAQSTATQMGSSRMAVLVSDSNSITHYLLAAISLTAAVLLMRSSIALVRPRMESQERLLSSLGWLPRSIRTLRGAEVACSMLPGIAVGISMTVALALIATQNAVMPAVSAAIGGCAACIVFFSMGGRR